MESTLYNPHSQLSRALPGSDKCVVGSSLPKWLQRKLHSAPKSPFGVHQFLFNTARRLHAYREPGQVETLLANAVKNCGRKVGSREIQEAISNAAKTFEAG
jgi:hypothetical protein